MMQLLDHFHPPLSAFQRWESFHASWADSIAVTLNDKLLPAAYFAEVRIHVGSRVDADVSTFEEASPQTENLSETSIAGTIRATPPWTPPEPTLDMPAVFPDSYEILVFHTETSPTLVASIVLISPSNKDRESHHRAFAAKCSSYLQQGMGLVTVDIVTNRQANLHNELVRMLDAGEAFLLPDARLYTTAYQPHRRADTHSLDVWPVATFNAASYQGPADFTSQSQQDLRRRLSAQTPARYPAVISTVISRCQCLKNCR